ncbi:MAG: hypothetical protein U5K75_09780 [Ahrensia sp.]|nr:hypothetical protein [Ahrensia sp.]
MPQIYSPLSGDEWKEPFELFPKTGFLMLQSGGSISATERYMHEQVQNALKEANYSAKTAVDLSRTGDYLHKITKLMLGCGFGIAIFFI